MWRTGGHKEILIHRPDTEVLARERLKNLLSIDEAALGAAYPGWV